MNEQENARARAEAVRSDSALRSADRARFWAGLNRYLASELHHESSTPAPEEETAPHRAGDDGE